MLLLQVAGSVQVIRSIKPLMLIHSCYAVVVYAEIQYGNVMLFYTMLSYGAIGAMNLAEYSLIAMTKI